MPNTFSPNAPRLAGNLECLVHRVDLVVIFVANVDVSEFCPEEKRGDDHAFDDQVGRAQQKLAVLEGRRLAFVGVADDVFLVAPGLHDVAPFLRGRSACAPHAAEGGLFQLGDQPLAYSQSIGIAAGGLELFGECSRAGIEPLLGTGAVRCPLIGIDPPGHVACGRLGQRHLMAFEMGRDDRAQPRSKVAVERLLEDANLLGLAGFVQLDEHGRRAVASTQAGDAFDLDAGVVAEVSGNHFEPREATRRTAQVAGDVAADANLDIRRRLAPKVREEADDLVNPVQRDVEPVGEPLELLVRQIADTLLDRT